MPPIPVMLAVKSLRESRENAELEQTLLVTGVMADVLARELAGDGDASVVRTDGWVDEAAGIVVVLSGAPSDEELDLLRRAQRAGAATVAVQLQPGFEDEIPYVLAADVVDVPSGAGFPVEEIVRALTRRMGEGVVPIARALPRFRAPATRQLTRSIAARNATIAVLPWGSSVHLPRMVTNEIRLAFDLAAAHGREIGPFRLPDAGAAMGMGLGLREVSRRARRRVGYGHRLINTAVAYGGTVVVGELASLRGRFGP